MENGLRRNIKLIFYYFIAAVQQWVILPAMIIFYVTVLKYDAAAMAVSFSILVPMIMATQSIIITFKYTVGFGSSRKNFFLAGLINKLLYAVFFTLLACTVFLLYESVPFNIPLAIFLLFVVSMLVGVLGEFFGILMYKSAVLGFVIYMLSILGVTFLFLGLFLYSVNSGNGTNPLDWLYSNAVIIGATGICAVTACVFSVVNWVMIKKIEIKS